MWMWTVLPGDEMEDGLRLEMGREKTVKCQLV
jgi:hypothetical protein